MKGKGTGRAVNKNGGEEEERGRGIA